MTKKVRRYAAKRDDAEPAIVEALEGLGARVMKTDEVDLIVGYQGRTLLMEVKSRKKKLGLYQLVRLVWWPGEAYAVNNVPDAIKALRGELPGPDAAPLQVGTWYTAGRRANQMFYQVTATRFLLGKWWYDIGECILPEDDDLIRSLESF